jgi:hypothetical protein
VPEQHPLRDPRTIRRLDFSGAATVVKADMQRELKRLMYGTRLEQDLLGLLTAAGGGLSSRDFAELTGVSEAVVNDHLTSVAGRSFTPRGAHWRPNNHVYVLAHEELQVRAAERLGPQLAGYLARLHEWASRYAARGWPDDSPEYLLRGYVSLLRDTGDVDRLIALALTATRRARLVRRDPAAAIVEVDAVREAVAAAASPDLLTLTRLAHRRDELVSSRRSQRPDGANRCWEPTPEAWKLFDLIDALCSSGDVDRARGIAERLVHPAARAHSLAAVAAADATAGSLASARDLVEKAEAAARGTRICTAPTRTYARITLATAAIGDRGQTRAIVSRVGGLARNVPLLGVRAQILAHLACAAATGGQDDQAGELISEVHVLANQLRDTASGGAAYEWLLAILAEAHIAGGDRRQAESLRGLLHGEPAYQVVIALARAAAAVGDHDKADGYLRSLCPAVPRAHALAVVAEEAALADDYHRAQTLMTGADTALRGVAGVMPSLRIDASAAFEAVAHAAAVLGRRLAQHGHCRQADRYTAHAQRLLAHSFSSSDYWTGLLKTLGLIDRSLLSAVADEIIHGGECREHR